MSLYPFPDVPNLPGVPAIPRSPLFPPIVTAGLGLVEGLLWSVLQIQTRWGIFNQSTGKALGNPTQFLDIPASITNAIGLGATLSTNAVDYRKETRVSDFPTEPGGFASYNKVELPATPTVTLCFDGSESERTTFLNQIEGATISTQLYNVVTPEIVYTGYTLEDYRYERRAVRGATLLMVQIDLIQIRQVSASFAQSQIVDPKDAGATPATTTGIVQPQTPVPSVLSSVGHTISGLASPAATAIGGLVQ